MTSGSGDRLQSSSMSRILSPNHRIHLAPSASNGLVELLPIDNAGTQLALERSFSVGAGNTVKLYEARTQGATDVAGFDDLFDESTCTTVPFEPVGKRFLLDFGDFVVPDNLEGLAFGPDLPDRRRLLIVVSDNNFAPSQVTQFIALAVSLD